MSKGYYYQAEHGQRSGVWSGFNQQESRYQTGQTYHREEDTKKSNINTIHDNDRNIENKYYGESGETYDKDAKYFEPEKGGDESNYMYWVGGAAVLLFFLRN